MSLRYAMLVAGLPFLVAACDKGTPSAGPDTSAAPSATAAPESRAKFLKLLEEGRKKARAKDFAGALAAFDRALAITPDDARVLSEIGWAALNAGELGRDYEPGAFGVHNEARVVGGEARTFGARRVVVVKSEQRNADQNMAGLELCEESDDLETVCALGSGATPTRCFTVPVRLSAGCGPGVEPDPAELDDDTKATLAEMKKGWHTSEARLSWSLGDDGKVVVKKVSGDDKLIRAGLLGPHALAP